ncbi:MAG: HAMP domain-containing methyl-accepting chemotaxis protein [Actinomycetota bacterium]
MVTVFSQVRTRLALIGLVFAVGIGAMYVLTDAKLAEQADDGALVNLSGRQRMLNQRHMKEVLFVVNGGEANFQGTRDLYLDTLEGLLDGGEVITNPGTGETRMLSGTQNADARAALEASRDGFVQIVAIADRMLAGTATEAEVEGVLDLVNETHAGANAAVIAFQSSAESKLAEVQSTLLQVGVLVLLVGGSALVLVSRSITRPLEQVVERAHVIADDGKVDDPPLAMRSASELGDLGRAFDEMQASLARHSAELRLLAEGHTGLAIEVLGEHDSVGLSLSEVDQRLAEIAVLLERIADEDDVPEVTVLGDHDRVGRSAERLLQTSIEKVAADGERSRILDQVSGYSAQLAAASEQLAASSAEVTEVAGRTETLSSQVKEAGGSVNEISASVSSSVAELTSSTAEIATSAHDAALKAGEAEQLTDRSAEAVERLDDVTRNIGEVIDVIRNIADQTNLLALNAAIEAARAGEAGRGFAVVASEVKGLAEESARSIDLIADRVEEVQTGAAETVSTNGEVADLLREMTGLVRSIAGSVEQQAATTSDLGERVDHLARAAADINGIATSVDEAASVTRQASGESVTAANSLADLATDMTALTHDI